MSSRQDNDPTMVNSSSIALLQERFRQLEKVKERREGKQLVRSTSSIMHNPAASQPRLMVPDRPTLHDSVSFGVNLTSKQGDQNTVKSPSSSNLWPRGASTSRNFDSSDVDTSLHL